MKVAIVSAIDNGVGLERDYHLLKRLIEADGHEVVGVHHKKTKPISRFDLVIFCETYVAGWGDLAPVRWMIPNPEWWFSEWDQAIHTFDRVLCKTRDAERIFSDKGARTVFTGFEAEDRMDAGVVRERRFLHIAGESLLKGTAAVIDAWERFALPYPLTVVARKMKVKAKNKAVTVHVRLDDRAMCELQNRCLFSLQPSKYEGFGHALHEALSVGAVLATTDAPPMNELAAAESMMDPDRFEKVNGVTLAVVGAEEIRRAADCLWGMSEVDVATARERSRFTYDAETKVFRTAFLKLLRDVVAETARAALTRVTSATPRVTIVFPAHHSAHPLVLRSLLALRWQSADPSAFEVVVAGDGGDPHGNLQYAIDYAQRQDLPGRAFACRLVDSPRPRGDVPHRNHARNSGWKAARAAIVWILDADFIIPAHAVEHLIAEHDAALAIGRPAVFSPCLAGVGAIGPQAWIDKSTTWVENGQYLDFIAALECGGISSAYSGYPERYTGPDRPMSSLLGDLPEGMPILWRGLLEIMGGFDEFFGEWGGDKEELVDRLKGLARAGLFEIRLLSSVMALHQPHAPDPGAFTKSARPRQIERERRAKQIVARGPWWRPQLVQARAMIGAVLIEATPGFLPPPPEPPADSPEDEPGPHEILSAVVNQVQTKAKRSRAKCSVLGRWSKSATHELCRAQVDAHAVDLPSLIEVAERSVSQLVILDSLADLDGVRWAEAVAQINRVCSPGALLVLAERTKLGSRSGAGHLRSPIDYQRALRGMAVAGQRASGDQIFTIFSGRLVR